MLRRRLTTAVAGTLALAVLPPLALRVEAAPPAVVEPTVHAIAVGGPSTLSPEFEPGLSRYAIRTTPESAGQVTVVATTSDEAGTVRVNGGVVTGPTTVSGLEAGDEVSVIVDDRDGTAAYALVYLPAAFPDITTTVHEPGAGDTHVLLTLAKFTDPAPSYEVALDRFGVPAYLRANDELSTSLDLKPAPGGHYTVMRSVSASPEGAELVELDEQFQQVRTYRTVGLVDTDAHDAILRADGSRMLVAYEPDPETGLIDAVIQDISPGGEVRFEWNSADHFLEGETTAGSSPDYAHVNSVDETADGNLLVSFRNTSSVMKIARRDQGDVQEGEVIWRLGGRFSDFDFVDDPAATGPCAQHTATEVGDGRVLVYDNGSAPLGANPSYCVNQADPTGPPADRPQTRVTEYALDEEAGTASIAWGYEVPGRYAYFAGSAYRTGESTMIGWASARNALASEVGRDGGLLWESKTDDGYFTYRAFAHDVPDAIAPEVTVTVPVDGVTYPRGAVVVPEVRCTDRGGSTLRSCTLPMPLDTITPGLHRFEATATDGDGNTSTVTRTYTVPAVPVVHRPDLAVRGSGGWVGGGRYAGPQQTSVFVPRSGQPRFARLRVRNRGTHPDRFLVRDGRLPARFAVTYRYGGRSVDRLGREGWRTPLLAPGEHLVVRVRVRRIRPWGPAADLPFTVRSGMGGRADRVVLRLRG